MMKTRGKSVVKTMLAILLCITMIIPQGVVFASTVTPTAEPTAMPTATPEVEPEVKPEQEPTITPAEGTDEVDSISTEEDKDEVDGVLPSEGETQDVPQSQVAPTNFGLTPFASTDPLEITGVTVPATYGTISTNLAKLQVTVDYYINAASATGGKITVTIKNLGGKYFTMPDVTDISGTSVVDVANAEIKTVDDDVEITIPFIGGTKDSTGNITINVPFDHANWDGWLEDGKVIAQVGATSELNGKTQVFPEKDVKSVASNDKIIRAISSNPTSGVIDLDTPLKLNVLIYDDSVNSERWRYKPNTTLTYIIEIPKDAVVDLDTTVANGSGVKATRDSTNPAYDKLVWTIGKADDEGKIPVGGDNKWTGESGGRPNLTVTGIEISFPSGLFNLGQEITLSQYFEYTLVDDVPKQDKGADKQILIEQAGLHIRPIIEQMGYRVAVSIENSEIQSIYNGYEYIENTGGVDIPDVCYTWRNDPVKPIRVSRIDALFGGTTSYGLVEADIYSHAGAYVRTEEKIAYQNVVFETGGSLYKCVEYDESSEYVKEIRIYPLGNDVASVSPQKLYDGIQDLTGGVKPIKKLLVAARLATYTYARSWSSGNFPDGTPIEHNDASNYTASLSWPGENNPESFEDVWGTAYDYDGGTTISTLELPSSPNNYLNQVWYGKKAPMPRVSYVMTTGEPLLPGRNVNVNLSFVNHNLEYGADDWKNPALLIALPDVLELSEELQNIVSTGETIPVYKGGTTGASVGSATISQMIRGDGKVVYKVQTSLSLLTRGEDSSANRHHIPLTFKVKNGAQPGTYFYAHNRADGSDPAYQYPSTAGMLFGTSADPDDCNIIYNPNEAVTWYYDDVNGILEDVDGSVNTNYLRKSMSNQSFTVAQSKELAVGADLFNSGANGGVGEWQAMVLPGAQTSVDLDETGTFRLKLENKGNTFIGDIELLNILPGVGDKTVLGETAKGSVWEGMLDSLDVVIYDENGDPIDNPETWYTLEYCLNADPEYTFIDGVARAGDGNAFADDATQDTARSFLLKMINRLPGGYTLEIEGVIKAPSTAGETDIGKHAYNSFAVSSSYYDNATNDVGKQVNRTFEPTKQTLVLSDTGTSSITAKAFVFADVNANDTYDAGVDTLYNSGANQIVELYRLVGSDWVIAGSAVTNALGQYTFVNLAGATYRVKVLNPFGVSNTTHAFATIGSTSNPNASHVDSNGYGASFGIGANVSVDAPTNAGIKAKGQVSVKYMKGLAHIGATQYVFNESTGLSDFTAAAAGGTITPGAAPYTLPTGYVIKSGSDTSKTYAITWDSPTQVLEFEVEEAEYGITYVLNDGTNDASNPATYKYLTGVASFADATKTGYVFDGWFSDAGFNTPVTDIDSTETGNKTLYAKFSNATYNITYELPAGAINPNAAITTYVFGTGVASFASATLTGHTFTGWFDAASAGNQVINIANDATGDKKLYARFSVNSNNVTYTITNATLGGGTAPATVAHNYGSEVTIAGAPSPAPAGYKFSGWSTTSGVTITDGKFDMPDAVVAFEGEWEALDTTAYKVEHYQANLAGDDYVKVGDTEGYQGTTAMLPNTTHYAAKSFAGFTYERTTFESDTITTAQAVPLNIDGDGSLLIKVYYTRNSYGITYKYDPATQPSSAPNLPSTHNEKFGDSISVPTLSLDGYTFTGWNSNDASVTTTSNVTSFTMPSNAVELVGSFSANTDTKYTVKHYQKDLGLSTYTEVVADRQTTLIGTTDGTAAYTPKTYTGFTTPVKVEWVDSANPTQTSALPIAGDESLVISIYYDRIKSDVTYAYTGATPIGTPPTVPSGLTNVEYGAEVTIEDVLSLTGYTFDGWNTTSPIVETSGKFAMLESTVAFTGSFIPGDGIKYKVEHYKQKLDGATYETTPDDVDNSTGTTSGTASYTFKTYSGFTKDEDATTWSNDTITDSATELKIAPDGSLVIKVYYTRNKYEVSYAYAGTAPKSTPPALSATTQEFYDTEITVTNPILGGYTFSGWSASDVTIVSDKFNVPADDVAFTGEWTANNNTAYTVKYYQRELGATTYKEITSAEENLTGTTDTIATYTEKIFTGFTIEANKTTWEDSANPTPKITELDIAGDDSLVISVYYDRNKHNVSYAYTGVVPAGVPAVPTVIPAEYEEEVTVAPVPTMVGYTFSGWNLVSGGIIVYSGMLFDTSQKFEMKDTPVAFTGEWIAGEGIEYKVEHYQQSVKDATKFDKVATESLKGTTGEEATFTAKDYDGFTYDEDKTTWEDKNNKASEVKLTIAPDGSLVIKLYYNRNKYEVEYLYTGSVPDNAPSVPVSADEAFEAVVSVAKASSVEGYTFSGWTSTEVTIANGKFDMPSKKVVITGEWKKNPVDDKDDDGKGAGNKDTNTDDKGGNTNKSSTDNRTSKTTSSTNQTGVKGLIMGAKTGDPTSLLTLFGLMAISGLGVAMLVAKKRRVRKVR